MGQFSDTTVDRWRRHSRWLIELCIDRAERHLAAGRHERAASRLQLAARIAAAGGSGYFAHPRLERTALALAATLPAPETHRSSSGPRRWLHVVTALYSVGGHTALIRRWIDNDRSGDVHTVVLTGSATVPPSLEQSVERAGGTVTPLSGARLIDRGAELRAAARDADVVLLHHHMWDIVPALAFGVPGGPPVLLLNHADHIFWVGAAVADLAVNLRPVGTELNRRYRSIDRNIEVPIPLELPPDPATRATRRTAIRAELGIPPDATVFLTIGSGFKYTPIGELDFPAAARKLLDRLPNAYLIAVGPHAGAPEWRPHVRALHPRLMVLGPNSDIAPYHAAADIYLEGFPFDSATALLEAALSGLPAVTVPAVAPLPFSAHAGLKSAIPQPATVAGYIDDAVRLAQSPELRQERADRFRTAIAATSTPDTWPASLAALAAALPREHHVYPVADAPLDDPLDRFLARLAAPTHRTLPLKILYWLTRSRRAT